MCKNLVQCLTQSKCWLVLSQRQREWPILATVVMSTWVSIHVLAMNVPSFFHCAEGRETLKKGRKEENSYLSELGGGIWNQASMCLERLHLFNTAERKKVQKNQVMKSECLFHTENGCSFAGKEYQALWYAFTFITSLESQYNPMRHTRGKVSHPFYRWWNWDSRGEAIWLRSQLEVGNWITTECSV